MQWSQWVALISGTFATVLNLALLPLILIFSSEKIGAYKYCLLFYTMTAALMTICQINTLAVSYFQLNTKEKRSIGLVCPAKRVHLLRNHASLSNLAAVYLPLRVYCFVPCQPHDHLLEFLHKTLYPNWVGHIKENIL